MNTGVLSADYKETPYWWEALPAEAAGRDEAPVPATADAAIVGGGLTGVAAAWELAKAGRNVVVLDAGEPGAGASTRNAGMIGRYSKNPFGELLEAFGPDVAQAYFAEVDAAYKSTVQRIQDEKFDCDFRWEGRFTGAISPAHHAKMVKEYEKRAKYLGETFEIVPVTERVETASQHYYGGLRLKNYGAIQPALYYRAMRDRAVKMGARLVGHAPATGIRRDAGGFEIATPRGRLRARDVIIATNGYTGAVTPWLAERVSPINAYMVATEKLSPAIAASILPLRCPYHDTRLNSNFMQMSPDGQRLLFGGRTGRVHGSLKDLAAKLHAEIAWHFPQLRDVKISHAWTGRCATTSDHNPHIGVHDGMHYALGYCFVGITMGPYLGTKVAKRILGAPDADTIYADKDFPKVAWIKRQPRAISLYMAGHVWADDLRMRRPEIRRQPRAV